MSVIEIPGIKGEVVSGFIGAETDSDELTIAFASGKGIRFFHEQNCCEHVRIAEVIGDFSDFVGQPITAIEERSSEGETDYGHETWTFYEFVCPKGTVTVRWLGESNGFYCEDVEWRTVDLSEKERVK